MEIDNNEDFECNPKGECWCKEEEFPPIPDSYDKDKCLSPEAIEQLRIEQLMVSQLISSFDKDE